MAQTKPKAAQFYGVSGNGTAGQVLISDGNGGMSWGSNTEQFTVSWATPTGQSLTYTQPSPQSSVGAPGASFPTTTFTATKSGEEISGTATIAGLPTGITASQSLSGSGVDNILTVTLAGVFPGADSLNTALTISGLTITIPLVVSYLVIAGGGGGGGSNSGYTAGGGGGAGGFRNSFAGNNTGGGGSAESTLTLSAATNYTVTVGGGGTAGSTSTLGGNGSNSVFSSIISTGGGGGGSAYPSPPAPLSGGSGGGSTDYNNTPGSRVSNPIQGYTGGTAYGNSTADGSGGGGGAGAVGSNGGNTFGGNGGNGLSNSITGSAVTYGGGGGGGQWLYNAPSGDVNPGQGGTGGGGNAGTRGSHNGNNGTTNTGAGAGGGSAESTTSGNVIGGVGGSGIVILRYPSSYAISGLSGTTTTVGTDKVTTFTSGTGNIQFN